ncbi:MAG: metallophosphoesterase [Planctomycetota bacterium]
MPAAPKQAIATEPSSGFNPFDVHVGDSMDLKGGIFVSDLHLLSMRCDSQRAIADLHRYDSSAQCIVLGGDTFDFRWSTQGGCEETCNAAMRWLKGLLAATGKASIFFLLGNHDCLPEFEDRLRAFSENEPRFHLVPHVLLLDDCLFLHGDITHAGSFSKLAEYRKKYHHHEPRSKWQHRWYDRAVRLRVPGLVSRTVCPTAATCRRLSEMIEEANLTEWSCVKSVFFGHTHVAANGYNVDSRQFFNPGSGIRFMKYLPHTFTFQNSAR